MKRLIVLSLLLTGCTFGVEVDSKKSEKPKPKLSIFKNLGHAPGPIRNNVSYFTHNGNDCYVVNHYDGTSIFCLKQ